MTQEIATPSAHGIFTPILPRISALLSGKAASAHTHVAADLPAALQRIFSGTGSPEGVVTAAIGSLFLRTDGGAGTALYVKESGAGNTGWAAK